MTRKMIALALGVMGFALVLIAGQANAQSGSCGTHEAVVERLAEGWGESRQSIGLSADNMIVEVFASLETGTWTITVSHPNGQTCLVASGQAYQQLDEQLALNDQGT